MDSRRLTGLDLKDFVTTAPLPAGEPAELGFTIESLPLMPGTYQMEIHLKDMAQQLIEFVPQTFKFEVAETEVYGGRKLDGWFGNVGLRAQALDIFTQRRKGAKMISRIQKLCAFAPLRREIFFYATRAKRLRHARPHSDRTRATARNQKRPRIWLRPLQHAHVSQPRRISSSRTTSLHRERLRLERDDSTSLQSTTSVGRFNSSNGEIANAVSQLDLEAFRPDPDRRFKNQRRNEPPLFAR